MLNESGSKDSSNQYHIIAKGIVIGTVSLGFIFLVLFLFNSGHHTNWKSMIDTEEFSRFGEALGGLASAALGIASIYLILASIRDAREVNAANIENDRNAEIRQRTESRFFELVNLYSNIKSDLQQQHFQFHNVYGEIDQLYTHLKDYVRDHSRFGFGVDQIFKLSYTAVYYGLLHDPDELDYHWKLQSLQFGAFDMAINADVVQHAIKFAKQLKLSNPSSNTTFQGHQFQLSRYFRFVFYMVKFVDESSMTNDKRQDYLTILKSLMSWEEIILIIIHSKSQIGTALLSEMNMQDFILKYDFLNQIPRLMFGYNLSPIHGLYAYDLHLQITELQKT